MRESFFNEFGIINLDESVTTQPSFIKIMEDKVVTDEEIAEQAELIKHLYERLEQELNDEQVALVKQLLVESNVFQSVYLYSQLQNIKF